MDIKELISMTISCQACQGKGTQPDKESTGGTKPCQACNGSGIVIDNFIADSIKKSAPEMNRANLGKCVGEIYEHYGVKLQDAYKRGYDDGLANKAGTGESQDQPVKTAGS